MAKMTKIENVLSERYGVGAVRAQWETVTWAVSHLAELHGIEYAAKEMRRLNRIREKHGTYTDIPVWGSDLWKAYFPK